MHFKSEKLKPKPHIKLYDRNNRIATLQTRANLHMHSQIAACLLRNFIGDATLSAQTSPYFPEKKALNFSWCAQ